MAEIQKKGKYRFTFGPWNISQGADPFGPTVRKEVAFAAKLREYKKLGFDGVQLHDDDAVPDLDDLDAAGIEKAAAKLKKTLDGEGLFAEFVAPRLWEHPKTIDGGYTSQQRLRPQVCDRAVKEGRGHRACRRHDRHRVMAGARGHVYPRGEGPDDRGEPYPRRGQRAAGARQRHPHPG